ncbi:MAG: hypothetical protein E7773_03555 [Sphingomonas sp.]|uniref:right-handed parallel beta-helix repeat-containing protein n=1 Tax=Sphingomonas sp. TaxID=28214 RepID=UPI00122A9DE2|nr:right-handed parallel beta-helix repeat-containing protein [Sphingomonas sp.]THD37496.1 MAG: hypothetical protein E7773_03555 [Sphingomonas sp.]
MKKLFVTVLAAMVALFVASPAMAQATRTWVSGVGDDANPCSRTAPCKTFAGAESKTATGGEIDCLDPGGFGAVTIVKSLTIDCTGTFGSILASAVVGVNVNDSSSPNPGTAKVVLRGLSINGAGSVSGIIGVRVSSARDVLITDSFIGNFSTAGVSVNATSQARVTIDHATLYANAIGIQVSPASTFSNSVKVSNSTIAVSSTSGISLVGSAAKGYIENTVITGTPKALDLQSGAVMNSYGNNVLDATATDAPTPTPLQ